jgi:anthranilate synthase component 2
MILIIDNYDSFTYNLYQQIESLGKKTVVFQHDKITLSKIEKLNPESIIISPGPGRPNNSKISLKVVQKFYTKYPILGVCLGHECIGQIFGSQIAHAKKIMHGKVSKIHHCGTDIFKNLKNPFKAARYHSLILNSVPKDFTLTAWTEDKEIMAIKHNKYPVFGVQFHPESFLTEEGKCLMYNFLYNIR